VIQTAVRVGELVRVAVRTRRRRDARYARRSVVQTFLGIAIVA
jgi:hypothetical protein